MGNIPVVAEVAISLQCLEDVIKGNPEAATQRWKDYSEASVIGSGVRAAMEASQGNMEEANRFGKAMGRATGSAILGGGILKNVPIFHELATAGASLGDVIAGGDVQQASKRWEEYSEDSVVGSGVRAYMAACTGDYNEAERLGVNMGKAASRLLATAMDMAVIGHTAEGLTAMDIAVMAIRMTAMDIAVGNPTRGEDIISDGDVSSDAAMGVVGVVSTKTGVSESLSGQACEVVKGGVTALLAKTSCSGARDNPRTPPPREASSSRNIGVYSPWNVVNEGGYPIVIQLKQRSQELRLFCVHSYGKIVSYVTSIIVYGICLFHLGFRRIPSFSQGPSGDSFSPSAFRDLYRWSVRLLAFAFVAVVAVSFSLLALA